jgi:tetratricopeptide (TPR) repeat protein
MVGRDRERSTLWRALFDVHTEMTARAVLVESPLGQGKSTLFDWFTTRARELGGASVLSAIHSAHPGPSDGLGPMLARSLRTTGLSRDAALAPTLDAVRRMGGRVSDAIALVEITHPVSDRDRGDGPSVRFANARERTHSVLRYIELLCRERPVIVRVDDGHFAPDALALVRALLDAPTPLPVLCVLDADPAALADRPAEATALDELRAHPKTHVTALSALSTDEQRALVQGLLSLRPSLVDAVVERAGASPLFAVQLVTDWVQRGVVRASADGFDLLGDEAVIVAAQLHALLLGRVTRRLDALQVACVERAATLGAAFDPAEWRAAGASLDATIDATALDAALDALVLDGLLVRDEDRCAFAHAAIVEALVRNARERGALAEHHRAYAIALSARPAAVAKLARVARHLALSGDFEAALAPMLEAAWESYERSDFAAATALLTERDQWIDAMDLAESDPRRAEGWVRLALVCARTAKVTDAGAWLDRVEAFVRAHRSEAIEADLVHGRARVAQMSGDMQRSGALFAHASRSYAALSRAQGVALSEHGLAEVLKQAGRAAESEPHYAAALTAYERAGDRVGAANCRLGWAELVNRTDRARGDAMLTEAVCALEAVGNRLGVAIAQQIKGLAARYDGRLEEAHDAFVRAAEMLDAVGSHDAAIARSNAGVVDLLRGRFVRATRVFEDVHRLFTRLGREGYLCFASVELLACRAHAGDWASFDALIEEAERLLPKSGLVDEDLELCLRIAMEQATRHEQHQRAARVEPLWSAQQRALAEQAGYSQ